MDEGYEVVVSRGYRTLTESSYIADADETVRDVHIPLNVGEKQKINGMIFGGLKRCSYPIQKFSSDSERAFASLLETDTINNKWFKPTRDQFQISYRDSNGSTAMYEPDFVAETADCKYIFEPKQQSAMTDPNVIAKRDAAVAWCKYASDHELKNYGKPWVYVLIPHTAIVPSATLKGLIQQWTVS